MQPYWNVRDELSSIDGIILKGNRVVIPRALRRDILQQLHVSHLGMEKSKQRARSSVYWPNMNSAIEDLIRNCEACGKFSRNNQKEPLISTPIPQYPWEYLGIDLCKIYGRDYIVTSDYYSRFIEIDRVEPATSSEVIKKLKAHFARYGIPEKIRSDNGPQFTSYEFQSFLQKWDIQHLTSSPNFPQSNGHAEKAVDIASRIMLKAIESNTDPYLGLLEYRNTPVNGEASPA